MEKHKYVTCCHCFSSNVLLDKETDSFVSFKCNNCKKHFVRDYVDYEEK